MPNKSVPGWTQVPVTATELLEVKYERIGASTTFDLTARYQVKDSLGAIRNIGRLTQQVASYPVAAATILASINTAEGT